MSIKTPERAKKRPLGGRIPNIVHLADPFRKGWTMCGIEITRRTDSTSDCVVCNEIAKTRREKKN